MPSPTRAPRSPADARRRNHAATVPASIRGPLVVAAVVAVMLAATISLRISPASAAPAFHNRTARERTLSFAVAAVINLERAAHGLPPLQMRYRLREAARAHTRAMVHANLLTHQLPGEPDIGQRLDDVHYRWSWAGENVAWNSVMSRDGVLQLERLMYHEKAPDNGHRRNILSPHYTDVGVDVYFDHRHGKVWLTTDFGRPFRLGPG